MNNDSYFYHGIEDKKVYSAYQPRKYHKRHASTRIAKTTMKIITTIHLVPDPLETFQSSDSSWAIGH